MLSGSKSKKGFLSGAASALLCTICCLVPITLIFIGINTIGLYLFLSKFQIALWGILILTATTYFIIKMQPGHGIPIIRRLLFLSLIFTATMLYLSYTSAPIIIPPSYPGIQNDDVNTSSEEDNFSTLTAETNGITVEINDIRTEGGNTIIMFSADNHAFDVSQFDPIELSSLAGIKPVSYEITNVEMGGHHIDAELTFESVAKGQLTIAFNEKFSFNFELP